MFDPMLSDAVAALCRECASQPKIIEHVRLKSLKHRDNFREIFESGEMEAMMQLLAMPNLPRNALQGLSHTTAIPLGTLRSWRRQLRTDPRYRPYAAPANIKKRALTPEQEEKLWTMIRTQFIEVGKYCPAKRIEELAFQIRSEEAEIPTGMAENDDQDGSEAPIPENEDEYISTGSEKGRLFRGSRHWRRNFMKRWELSLRKPHAQRRPVVQADAVAQFKARIEGILQEYPLDHVLNMDETSWKLLNYGFVTVA